MIIKVLLILVSFTLIFSVRSVFNLLYTWGLIPRFYPEDFMNPVFWDAIVRMQWLLSI
jgi:hypothetical protein